MKRDALGLDDYDEERASISLTEGAMMSSHTLEDLLAGRSPAERIIDSSRRSLRA